MTKQNQKFAVSEAAAPESPVLTYSSSSNFLVRFDEDLGYYLYQACQNSKVPTKLTADVFSISGDEIVWFGAPATLGSFLFALRVSTEFPLPPRQ